MLRPGSTDVVDMIRKDACQEEEVMRQRLIADGKRADVVPARR